MCRLTLHMCRTRVNSTHASNSTSTTTLVRSVVDQCWLCPRNGGKIYAVNPYNWWLKPGFPGRFSHQPSDYISGYLSIAVLPPRVCSHATTDGPLLVLGFASAPRQMARSAWCCHCQIRSNRSNRSNRSIHSISFNIYTICQENAEIGWDLFDLTISMGALFLLETPAVN